MKTLECRRCGEPGMLLGGVCRECKAEPEENPAMASDALEVRWIDVEGKPVRAEFEDAVNNDCHVSYVPNYQAIRLGIFGEETVWLGRPQARVLAGILLRFADTGELGPGEEGS